jgi:hypothetical protein
MKIALIVPGFSAHEKDWCIPALLDYVRVLAQLAEVHVFKPRPPHPTSSISPLPWRFRLWSQINPHLLIERLRYRHLLGANHEDGRYLEARLFILEKPL